MREIQALDAETQLHSLLDAVEGGETVVITRGGRAIARIVPEVEPRRTNARAAIEAIRATRKTLPRIPLEELLAARHEGHRY